MTLPAGARCRSRYIDEAAPGVGDRPTRPRCSPCVASGVAELRDVLRPRRSRAGWPPGRSERPASRPLLAAAAVVGRRRRGGRRHRRGRDRGRCSAQAARSRRAAAAPGLGARSRRAARRRRGTGRRPSAPPGLAGRRRRGRDELARRLRLPRRVLPRRRRARSSTRSCCSAAYLAGMSASSIAFVPGGFGVIEVAMIATLHAGGVADRAGDGRGAALPGDQLRVRRGRGLGGLGGTASTAQRSGSERDASSRSRRRRPSRQWSAHRRIRPPGARATRAAPVRAAAAAAPGYAPDVDRPDRFRGHGERAVQHGVLGLDQRRRTVLAFSHCWLSDCPGTAQPRLSRQSLIDLSNLG